MEYRHPMVGTVEVDEQFMQNLPKNGQAITAAMIQFDPGSPVDSDAFHAAFHNCGGTGRISGEQFMLGLPLTKVERKISKSDIAAGFQ